MTTYPNFDATSLFAGEGPYHSRPITAAGNQGFLKRGTMLGRVSIGTAVAAAGTNTGNGALTLDATTPTLVNAQPGAYLVKFTGATTYNVFDPKGNEIGQGAVGTAFANEIKFNIAAGGTAFVANDSFTVTITDPDKYVVSKATAIDGSQIPSVVTAQDIDTTAGDVVGPGHFDGAFTAEVMTIDASWSLSALRAALRKAGSTLFIKSAGSLG